MVFWGPYTRGHTDRQGASVPERSEDVREPLALPESPGVRAADPASEGKKGGFFREYWAAEAL